ncbi:reverse transcriptase domain-containing protein [Streptomyces sp. JNUCC 63]
MRPRPVSKSVSASCGCWSRTSSSAPRRSPSATASPSGGPALPAGTTTAAPTRRVTVTRVIYCVGGVSSPVLANLYLHYAFDVWLAREFPQVTFERYCDDAVIHCGSERQARRVRDALAARLAQVGLELHPDKTRIVCVPRAQRERSACR